MSEEKTTKRVKENLVERDWKIARGLISRDRISWPQALRQTRALTEAELNRIEQTPVVLEVKRERGLL